jgi:hypothetical protein
MKVVGNNKATLIGSDNTTDYFTYAGGSVTIRSYIEDPDDIFIGEGFTITGQSCPIGDGAAPNVTLWVTDKTADSVGTILLEGVVTDNPHKTEILVHYEEGGSQAVQLTADHFDTTLKSSAREVSIVGGGKTRDYGIQSKTPSGQETLYTAEYFNDLKQIKATTDNSTIIGNKESNVFIAMGGDSNLFTGGMGSDTFIFGSQTVESGGATSTVYGGGIITDFGAGALKRGDSSLLAQSPTQIKDTKQIAYNRNAPKTYAEGNDVLKVNGTVVEIAFKYYDSTTNTAKQPVFSAYVTYDADGNTATTDDQHTILLGNIAKPASKYNDDINKATYKTDEVAVRTSLKIWDTSSGTMSQLNATALAKLFANTDDYNATGNAKGTHYLDNITALDAIVNNNTALDIIGLATSDNTINASNGLNITQIDPSTPDPTNN